MKTEKIDPKEFYSLNDALRHSPLKSYITIRRYVDLGKLKATKTTNGYKVQGKDLIQFISSLEDKK